MSRFIDRCRVGAPAELASGLHPAPALPQRTRQVWAATPNMASKLAVLSRPLFHCWPATRRHTLRGPDPSSGSLKPLLEAADGADPASGTTVVVPDADHTS